MAHKRTATLLYTTEENLTVPEFFAVGRPLTAVLLCAVKGGVSMPQTKNICDFQGSSEPIFLAQFFIGHLTLSFWSPSRESFHWSLSEHYSLNQAQNGHFQFHRLPIYSLFIFACKKPCDHSTFLT